VPRESAGLLPYRRRAGALEVFLVHPGGPFWVKKDEAAWSLPKGLIDAGEDELRAARREFAEETGFTLDQPDAAFADMGSFKLLGGKRLRVFALEGDCDPAQIKSNRFEMVWPPNSGNRRWFPEVDRAGWFALGDARRKINAAQCRLLDALEAGRQAETRAGS